MLTFSPTGPTSVLFLSELIEISFCERKTACICFDQNVVRSNWKVNFKFCQLCIWSYQRARKQICLLYFQKKSVHFFEFITDISSKIWWDWINVLPGNFWIQGSKQGLAGWGASCLFRTSWPPKVFELFIEKWFIPQFIFSWWYFMLQRLNYPVHIINSYQRAIKITHAHTHTQ